MSQDALQQRFRNPGPEFRTAVFWFWHRLPTEDEIIRQLADMRAKNVGAVMIQARPALELRSYLSPGYLAAYRRATAEARRQGLRVTIYDEYGWMSGHGGGRTVRGADRLREQHLFWTTGIAGEGRTELTVSNIRSPFLDFLGEAGRTWVYEGGAPRWADWHVALVIAHADEPTGLKDVQTVAGAAEILATDAVSCRIAIDHGTTVPTGRAVTAFVSARCVTSRLINYLLPEAAERFAETVYAPLLEAADGVADGFFFDHPHAGFYRWDEHRGNLGNSLLWDAALVGPDDAMGLLSLVRDVGPGTAALRAGFFERHSRRMHEAFFGTLARWAAKRGVGFTGHELLTHVGAWGLHDGLTGLDSRAMPGVDYFGIDAFRSETSVDAVDYAPQLSAKLGDSVARANGRTRCTVEQYSTGRETGTAGLAGQWGLTAERFRAQAIRHILFGARRILLHAYNVSDGCDGDDRLLLNPRFDFPPAFNFEPWWEDCPAIFAELARLSVFLEEGEPVRPVALLYPLETVRAEGMTSACGEHFGWWAEAFAREGIGYDVVDERALGSTLREPTGYETLVLPAATTLASAETIETIVAFVHRGGRLLVSGPAPSKTTARGDDAPLVELLAGVDGRVEHLSNASKEAILLFVRGLPRPALDVRFADAGPSWCFVARCDGTWHVATFNDGQTTRSLLIRIGGMLLEVSSWDLATGDVTVVGTVRETLNLDIGSQQVVCLSIRNGSRACLPPTAVAQGGFTALPLDPIVLADGWTLEIEGNGPSPVAVDRGWEVQGFASFAGTGIYRRRTKLPRLAEGLAWHLALPGVRETAELWLDGAFVGRHVAGEARFALPVPGGGDVTIELRVRNTAANRYYSGTPYWDGESCPAGLIDPPRLVAGTAQDL